MNWIGSSEDPAARGAEDRREMVTRKMQDAARNLGADICVNGRGLLAGVRPWRAEWAALL